jgi:hypothetical protein
MDGEQLSDLGQKSIVRDNLWDNIVILKLYFNIFYLTMSNFLTSIPFTKFVYRT